MTLQLHPKTTLLLLTKKQQQGFTLIELLVVIIIIGILTAIALPSFLNQTVKARQAEAKNLIGAVNSGQSAFRIVNSKFANSFGALALGLPTDTVSYLYAIDGNADFGNVSATAKDTALKGYSGATEMYLNSNGEIIVSSTMCEAMTPGVSAPGIPTPSSPPNCSSVGMLTVGQ